MSTGAIGRGPYNTGVRRRAEILDAAVRVFGSRGYGGSTLKQIADEVGVTTAAVLRYFSKEELLTEVLKHWDASQRNFDVATSGLDYFRSFEGLMKFHIANSGFLELYLTFVTEASDSAHPAHQFLIERHARTIALMQTNLRVAIELEEIPIMLDDVLEYEASAFCAMLDGFEIQWLLNRNVNLVDLVTCYTEQAINRWERTSIAQPAAS